MDSQNIDQLFRKALEASEGHYNAQANHARDRIWKQVQKKNRKPAALMLISLAAACLLLLLVSSFLSFSVFRAKKSVSQQAAIIEQLSGELASANALNKGKNVAVIPTTKPTSDTVFVEKERIVLIPSAITQVKVDTVYVNQTVYVEKEVRTEPFNAFPSEKEADAVSEEKTPVHAMEILISNREIPEKSKSKRLKIRLGGEREQTGSGTLALTAKY